jgi:hypothetical protein
LIAEAASSGKQAAAYLPVGADMQFLKQFYRSLTLKPQGFTMIVAGFLPVFAIIAMFPVVAAIIGHFKDDPSAPLKVPAMVTAPGYAIAVLAPFAGLFVD